MTPFADAPRPLQQVAQTAARLIVDEGLDYVTARRKAMQAHGVRHGPDHDAIEDEVRAHLTLYHADTQPLELRRLREIALQWMQRLAEFRPHLSGAVWRGTATRLSAVRLDLYCDDPKAAEIALINLGIDYDSAVDASGRGEPVTTLVTGRHDAALGDWVTVHLRLHDHDELRGALRPDARGRTWRGDLPALQRLLADDERPGD